MNYRKEFDNISEELQRALRGARESMNFDQLNQTVRHSVNEAMREVRRSVDEVRHSVRGGFQNKAEEGWQPFQEETREERQARQEASRARRQETETERRFVPPERGTLLAPSFVSRRPVGKVSGILYLIFGGILTGVFGILAAVFGGLWAGGVMGLAAGASTVGLFSVPAVLGIGMLFRGSFLRRRVGRFRKYVDALDDRKFAEIQVMAECTGKSAAYVRKDLKKMIALNMFPEARTSDDGKYLLLDQETYQQYENLLARQRELEEAEKKRREAMNDPEKRELQEAIEEGRGYIRQIREANDAIPGEVISQKLDRLEKITDKIFLYVEREPEQLPQLRRFMDYYLPTTMKLVNTYREFDGQPVQGENITRAKLEIEKTLDTINEAFEKLFDSLFADVAMDVSADISVLQTLLAQEGLTKDDFSEGR